MGEQWADAEQDADLTTIGGRIKWARKRRGISQQELADRLPADRAKKRAAVAQYEAADGNLPPLQTIIDIADVLKESPRFLAFGDDVVDQPSAGPRIPLRRQGDSAAPEFAILPASMLHDLGVTSSKLDLVQIDVDAPSFDVRSQDYALLDSDVESVASDGKFYVVRTSAGSALIRSEPALFPTTDGNLQITTGQGVSATAPADSLYVIGKLVALIQQRT